MAGLGLGLEFVLELLVADFGEEGAKGGAGFHAESDEVVTGEEGRPDLGLLAEEPGLGEEEVVDAEAAVGAEAVEAVEFEFEGEGGAEEEAAEGGFAHLEGVLELHVGADGFDDPLDAAAGEAEAAEDGGGNVGADFLVAVEVDAAGPGVGGGGEGFGDVVEEDGPG